MQKEAKAETLKRLNRIAGQVRGLAGMVRRVEEEILRDHVGHCVEHAIASGNKADQRRKIAELMDVVSRANR